MNNGTRKIIGSLGLGVYLLTYVIIATTIGTALVEQAQWLQFLFFAVAGIIWIFPLRPLFRWINKPMEEEDA